MQEVSYYWSWQPGFCPFCASERRCSTPSLPVL